MSGRKGMSRYGLEMKDMVVQEHSSGISIRQLSKQYGISRYAIQSWCGLRKEVEIRRAAPLPKGRPTRKPKTPEQTIKRLQMENELLRSFLSAVGRK